MRKIIYFFTSIVIAIVVLTTGLYLVGLHHGERYVAQQIDTYMESKELGNASYKGNKIRVTVNDKLSMNPQALTEKIKAIESHYQKARKMGHSEDQGLELVNRRGHVVAVHYGQKMLVTGDLGTKSEVETKKLLKSQGITNSNKLLTSTAKKAGFTIVTEPEVKNLFSVKPLLSLFDQELSKTDAALKNVTDEIQ